MGTTILSKKPSHAQVLAMLRSLIMRILQIVGVILAGLLVVLPYMVWLLCTPYLNACRKLRWNPPKSVSNGRYLVTFVKKVSIYGPEPKRNRILERFWAVGEPNTLHLIRFVDHETRETVAVLERRSLEGYETEHVHTHDLEPFHKNFWDVEESGLCCWVGTYDRIKCSPDEPCCHGKNPISREQPDMESAVPVRNLSSVPTYPDEGYFRSFFL